MIKFKTVHEYKFGQTNQVPFVGEIIISDQGIIEVDDSKREAVELLLAKSNLGFEPMDVKEVKKREVEKSTPKEKDDIKPQTEEHDFGKTEESTIVPQTEESGPLGVSASSQDLSPEDEIREMVIGLEKLDFASLKELASNYPKEEWGHFRNSIHLKSYLTKKLLNN